MITEVGWQGIAVWQEESTKILFWKIIEKTN